MFSSTWLHQFHYAIVLLCIWIQGGMAGNLLLCLLCGTAALHALVSIDYCFGEAGRCNDVVNGLKRHFLRCFVSAGATMDLALPFVTVSFQVHFSVAALLMHIYTRSQPKVLVFMRLIT